MKVNHRLIQPEFHGYRLSGNAPVFAMAHTCGIGGNGGVGGGGEPSFAAHKARVAQLQHNALIGGLPVSALSLSPSLAMESSALVANSGELHAPLIAILSAETGLVSIMSPTSPTSTEDGNSNEMNNNTLACMRVAGVASASTTQNTHVALLGAVCVSSHSSDNTIQTSNLRVRVAIHIARFASSDVLDHHAVIVVEVPLNSTSSASQPSEAVELARAVGASAPLAVFFVASGSSLVVIHSDATRPFAATYPTDPILSPSSSAFQAITVAPVLSPFDPCAPQPPKDTQLAAPIASLDDEMDNDEDACVSQQSGSAEGTIFLHIPLDEATKTPSATSVPGCSFLCATIPTTAAAAPILPLVCLKSSVDGVLCSIMVAADQSLQIEHVDTMHAFAYVASSKRSKRFVYTSRLEGRTETMAYIVESGRYLYAYRKKGLELTGEQWVVDLWEGDNKRLGDVRGICEEEFGKLVILCEDRMLRVSF
ncbi:hypothetical protein BC830DRAFT_1091021 [Chytriomyces sp. MP71]|nr:hypothetical protein BC830DRAFT_1091021 [Chytriomyces sp. MP71]